MRPIVLARAKWRCSAHLPARLFWAASRFLWRANRCCGFSSRFTIHFNEAIAVACVGLAVNVTSALLLRDPHHHSAADQPAHHGHGHGHDHDLNLKAAYIHVLADAVTSILAIFALVGGKMLGWLWLDPMMGLVGSAVISQWAYGLIRDTHVILLDKEPESSDLNAADTPGLGSRRGHPRRRSSHLAGCCQQIRSHHFGRGAQTENAAGVQGASPGTRRISACDGGGESLRG